MELWATLMVLVLSVLASEAQAQGLASVLEGEMREGLLNHPYQHPRLEVMSVARGWQRELEEPGQSPRSAQF